MKGFTFDGAMNFWFKAPHVKSFMWKFGLAYAVIATVLTFVLGYASKDAFGEAFQGFVALDNAEPEDVMGLIWAAMDPLWAWFAIFTVVSWIFWAVFETASQRRYVRDEDFYLSFGADEVRMMIVGLYWAAMQLIMFGLPALAVWSSISGLLVDDPGTMGSNEIERRVLGIFGTWIGTLFVLFPAYVFFATRFAPSFALTVKDRSVSFFQAWGVSKGRFWPILGAYVLLSIAGGIAASVIDQIFQLALMPTLFAPLEQVSSMDDVVAIITSPTVLTFLALYLFATTFIRAVLAHVIASPAAFAARHDPKGGVDDIQRLATFE